MGKAVQKMLKYKAETVAKEFPEKFSKDFDANKKAIDSLGLGLAKTNRNKVSGFVTRISNRKKD